MLYLVSWIQSQLQEHVLLLKKLCFKLPFAQHCSLLLKHLLLFQGMLLCLLLLLLQQLLFLQFMLVLLAAG